VELTPIADLSIAKTGDAEVVAGGGFDYTLTIANAGPSDAADVEVTDTLPTGVTVADEITAPSGWACDVDGSTITCAFAGTWSEASAAITIPVAVADPFDGDSFTNTATVTSATDDPDADDDVDSFTTDV